jgi:N-acetylglutamate synthase-like GNAT family acetyltransferase
MIRKAKIKDMKAIHKLLQNYGTKGELLPRPLSVYTTMSEIFRFT